VTRDKCSVTCYVFRVTNAKEPMRRFAVLTLLTACADAPSATTYTIDTLPNGVVHVVNTAPAEWSDTNGWKLTLERTIVPPVEGEGSIGRIGSLGVDATGMLYLFDPLDPVILAYRTDGTFSHRIGRNGDGPGEFRVGTFSIVGDTIAMQDAGNSRVVLFRTEGTPLGEWSGTFRAPDVLPVRHDGAIPSQAWLRDRVQTPLDQYPGRGWVYYRLDGTPLDTVRTPPVPRTSMWKIENERANFGITVPFAPDREMQLTQAGTVVWGDQSTDRLIYSRSGEDTIRIVDFPGTALPVPDSLRSAALQDALDTHDWLQGIARLEDIPTSYPRWLELALDGERVWLRRPNADGTFRWQVIDAEGRYLGDLPAPFEPNWRDQWLGDRIYHVTTTDDGVPAVEVWHIERSIP
jgi:hypothetical protein